MQPFRTSDDRIDGVTIVAVDIDLIKKTQDLTEERDYARAIVHAVREPLAVLDDQCRVRVANAAFYRLFQLEPQQMQGRPLWEGDPVVWGDRGLRKTLAKAARGEELIAGLQIEASLPALGARCLVLNGSLIRPPDGAAMLLLAIEDVTDARAAERLRIDAETLRQVDKRKDEFLGILAHELRNPLGPMRFALELMRRSEGDATKRDKQIQVLDRQVTHMVRIIDDLLDVSRITQGKLELRNEAVTLSSVVQNAAELCRPQLEAAGHHFKSSLPDEPVTLMADPVRLTQLLVNVLNNAIKFTPPRGHIYLIAEVFDATADSAGQVRIRIRDDGIGVPPELRPRIFDMFAQGDQTVERTRGGLGVGLTLVRNLAQLHGGTVDVRSEGVGKGTEVIIDLPTTPVAGSAEPASPPMPPSTPGRSLRILVADDDEDNRELLRYFLEDDGHTVQAVADGLAAVSAVQTFKPDVAILDIGMSGLSGFAVAERLREQHSPHELTLIAVSGLGQQEDKAKAAQAGFDVHFTKPVDVAALTRALMAVAHASDPGEETRPDS